MILSLEDFRLAYPGLTEELYPDSAVESRLAVAAEFFSGAPWNATEVLQKHVVGLYAAHCLTAHGSAASGGTGGAGASGTVTSKSVDGASVSYDAGSASETGAGWWNLTPYGKELYRLMQIFGAGARQL